MTSTPRKVPRCSIILSDISMSPKFTLDDRNNLMQDNKYGRLLKRKSVCSCWDNISYDNSPSKKIIVGSEINTNSVGTSLNGYLFKTKSFKYLWSKNKRQSNFKNQHQVHESDLEHETKESSATSDKSLDFQTPIKAIKVGLGTKTKSFIDHEPVGIDNFKIPKINKISVPKMKPHQSPLAQYNDLKFAKVNSVPDSRRRNIHLERYNSSDFSLMKLKTATLNTNLNQRLGGPSITKSRALKFSQDLDVNTTKNLEYQITHKLNVIEMLKAKLAQACKENQNLHSQLISISLTEFGV